LLQIFKRPGLQPDVCGLQAGQRGTCRMLMVEQRIVEVAEQDGHRIIEC
jgi:hypothetical protein